MSIILYLSPDVFGAFLLPHPNLPQQGRLATTQGQLLLKHKYKMISSKFLELAT
jgi:hypothetical protein